MDDITDYLFTKPEVLWVIVFIGAVAVIGLVDFLKNFIRNKTAVKWIVLVVSLAISIILSPLVPALITTIIILWLLILAVSTIARNTIVDGLPGIVSKVIGSMGNSPREDKK